MGLLDKLWDDSVAGPPPEAGLGRLRRHPTFSSSIRSVLQHEELASLRRQKALDEAVDAVAVSRCITIVRTPSFRSTDSGSPSLPSSPACGAPDSPFTPATTPRGSGEWGKAPQRKSSEAFDPRSPTVYD